MTPDLVSILCVDDNHAVCAALRLYVSRSGKYRWLGHIERADGLIDAVTSLRPAIVILDIDMPGVSAIEALGALAKASPQTRVVIFSGHSRHALVEAALEAGAWGYISKNDGEEHLFDAIDRVLAGEFVLSPEASAAFNHGE